MYSLNAVLMSRFLINLQRVKYNLLIGTSLSLSDGTNLEFRTPTVEDTDTFIGSFRGQFSFDGDDLEDGDGEES